MADNVGAINVKMGLDASKFKAALNVAQGQTNAFAGMAKMALGGIAAGFSVGTIVNEMQKAYQASTETLKIQRQLSQTLLTTGFASGMTADQLKNLAKNMDELSGVSQNTIMDAENILLTFRNINSDIFPETIQLSQDMATTMGQDLNSAILQVGKALNDPITGMTALRRMGVQFTQEQKDQIKTLVRSGDAQKAQAIILQELTNEFGGAAKAAKTNGQALTTNMEDIRREIGLLAGGNNPMTKFLANMTKGFKDWAYQVRITNNEIKDLGITDLAARLQKVYEKQNTFNEIYKGAVTGKKMIAERNKEYDTEAKAIMNQIKLIRERDKTNKETGDKTRDGLSFNTGKVAQTKKKDPALDAYQDYIKEFQTANNEYMATLKAKKYVEDTLGMSAIQVNKAEYDNAISAYKDYYAKIAEISQSQAINKGILLKKAEEKLQQDLKTSTLSSTQDLLVKQNELVKGYQEQMRSIDNGGQAEKDLGGFKGSFQAGYEQKLEILKWYYDEKAKLDNTNFATTQSKIEAQGQLTSLLTMKNAEVEKNIWKQRGQDISGILSNSFDSMLTGYGGFGVSMQQLALNLGRYMIQQTLETAIQQIAIEQMKAVAITALNAVTGFGGTIVSGISGAFSKLPFHHSGGQVPSQANYELPGTKEQLAMLKGGERVLSPAENASYNNNGGSGGSQVIVYSPQIKAWDSKDVKSYLYDNKNDIISIMTTATKNNTGGFRNIVRSV